MGRSTPPGTAMVPARGSRVAGALMLGLWAGSGWATSPPAPAGAAAASASAAAASAAAGTAQATQRQLIYASALWQRADFWQRSDACAPSPCTRPLDSARVQRAMDTPRRRR